ncbi:MAG: hypothetical protein QOG04_1919 [Actinomycetota bacterium]|nr:hypothetical protein [Actinomycetota bacterium]
MGKRRTIAKAGAIAYGGYKWIEDHTDDLERWSNKVIESSEGKSYAKFAVPPAKIVRTSAIWIGKNGDKKKYQSR